MPKGTFIYGKKIAAQREKRFLTQAEVAARMGMSVENVKRIEGREVVSVGKGYIPKLAEVLGLRVDAA